MSDATDAHLYRLHERVRGLERLALGRMKALSVIAVLAGVFTPSFPLRTDAGDVTVDLLGLASHRTDDGVVITAGAACAAVLVFTPSYIAIWDGERT